MSFWGAKKDEEPAVHPSQDHTARHPTDDLLRLHSFRIHTRWRNDEPRWTRGGKVYKQSEAVEIVAKERE